MKTRTIRKLLSGVLAATMFVSCFSGSIMGVNAAVANKSYGIIASDTASGTKKITYEVTLTDLAGMLSGKFDLMLGKDVIDDVNFDANGNYIVPVNETLEEFRGAKQETSEITDIYTDTETGELEKVLTGSAAPADYNKNNVYYVYKATGNHPTTSERVETSEVTSDYTDGTTVLETKKVVTGSATPTADFGYVWKKTDTISEDKRVIASEVTTDYEDNTTVLETKNVLTVAAAPSAYSENGKFYVWKDEGDTTIADPNQTQWGFFKPSDGKDDTGEYTWDNGTSATIGKTYTKLYKYNVYNRYERTYYKTETVNYDVYSKYTRTYYTTQTTTYDEYAKYIRTYYELVGGRDKDGNFMINGTNVYKTVDVYDEDGNKTGTKQVINTDATKEKQENSGNKGIALPNVFDGTIGLYNTKIEITGGTRVSDNGFSLSDFENDNYETFAKGEGNTTHAIEGTQNIDGVDYKYIYNMTDNYKLTHFNSNPVTYEEATDAEGNKTYYAIQNNNLLDKYYREYTTVDVATANLGYKISTVSEDSVGSNYQYAQYAQGFKDITFNSSVAYSSITFTVTLDFSGNCDRSSANNGVDEDKLTTVINGTNCRNNDGHWASENYIQYDKKYELKFISDDTVLSTFKALETGSENNYAHIHEGLILENVGLAEPSNKAAIDALLAKKPNAKEGVDYFELYDAKCNKCGQITQMIAAPDLPYTVTGTDANGNSVMVNAKDTKGQFGFNNFRNISGISLNYNDNGTVGLNIHYPSKMDGEQMIVTDENGMVLKCSDTIEKANDRTSIYTSVPSNYASKKIVVNDKAVERYDGYLRSAAQMITIDNLSAKEVDQTLYIARYTPSSNTETQLMGITHAISIADYCSQVIKGDKVYYHNNNTTKIEQDKAVAAAFINYAHASKNALAVNTNDYVERTIDLLEFGDYLINDLGSTSAYYDTKLADNGETGDSWENAIIIDSAEEFVYLSKASGNDTKGKYYKVADNIAGFNLSTDKLDLDGTLEDNLDIIKGSGKNHSGDTPGFQGHFDGNGATVYGAWTNDTWDTKNNKDNTPSYAGLFSCTKGDVTIKNLNVRLSYFVAKNAAGAIVGYHTLTKNVAEAKNETIASGKLVLPEVGSLTIENCSVTDCYIKTKGTGWGTGVGAIVGQEDNAWSDSSLSYVVTDTTNWTSTYEGVDFSKIITTTNASGTKTFSRYDRNSDGFNTYDNGRWDVRNCYVNLDPKYFISTSASTNGSTRGGVVAWSTTNGDTSTKGANVQNCIVIGITPYTTNASATDNNVQHVGLETHYQNVYTDQPAGSAVTIGGTYTNRNFANRVYTLTDDQLTGPNAAANMPKLDWYKTWCATEDYPTLYAPYNVPDVKKTIYWDGTTASGISEGSGTKADPYIINTVAELAWVVSRPRANFADTDGKYFKVSDDIGNIVLQNEAHADVINLNSAAETKAYFESASNLLTWKIGGWEGTTFCGNIDFNGATIYGLYQNSTSNAALFCNVDAGAVIRNLTFKNSYLTRSVDTNYQVGAIAAVANGPTYGKATNGIIWFDGITITNNYIYNPYGVEPETGSNDRSGIVMGASPSDAVYIDNCLVYGNDASWGAERNIMPLIASAGNSVPNTVVEPEGLDFVIDYTEKGEYLYFSMIRNSIILGCDPYDITQGSGSRFNDARSYKNVYTDQAAGTVLFKNGGLTFTTAQLKHVEMDEIYGSGAKTRMPGLDWYDAMTNPDGVWYFGYNSSMPCLSKIESPMLSDLQGAYDAVVFDTADTSGEGTEYHKNGTMSFGVYKTALSLKANPYMSFAFAFYGDYRTNRDKIKVRFTYTQNGATKITEEISVPAAVDENGDGKIDDIKNVNGWTNTASNGRYHTYKADQIPVEAMADGIKVEANYNGGEWKDLGTFSVAGLGKQFETAYNETPCEYYAVRVEAAKAFLFYVQQIKARYYNV